LNWKLTAGATSESKIKRELFVHPQTTWEKSQLIKRSSMESNSTKDQGCGKYRQERKEKEDLRKGREW
jgi:hypothetical protein